jgi:hypothetical protein
MCTVELKVLVPIWIVIRFFTEDTKGITIGTSYIRVVWVFRKNPGDVLDHWMKIQGSDMFLSLFLYLCVQMGPRKSLKPTPAGYRARQKLNECNLRNPITDVYVHLGQNRTIGPVNTPFFFERLPRNKHI